MNIKKGLGYEGVKIPQIVPQTSGILGGKMRKNKRKFEENGFFLRWHKLAKRVHFLAYLGF